MDVWRHLFGNPAVAAEAWTEFLDGPEEEVRQNAGDVEGWVAARIGRFALLLLPAAS